VTTADLTAAAAKPVAIEKSSKKRPKLADTWWRHVVALVACLVSLFPIWFVMMAALNRDQSVSATGWLPLHFTLHNFGDLLHGNVHDASSGSIIDAPFLRWLLNTLIVSIGTAVLTILVSAFAAYAFSRFRFKGRRFGMLALLLVQMFPQVLLVVSIYLIVLNTGQVFSFLGEDSFVALVMVYLGGAMGVNTWLMKGFFDSIPKELDESARVDGATAGQIFWGVVLPLALPILAVIGLWSFIASLNEFVLASVVLVTTHHFTLPVGMRGFIDQQFGQRWGFFAAGALMAAVPAAALFMWLQRFIVSGLSQGAVKG
jgi:arabinogalactan oligomer/maltooligosaccharide transport system permease protein